MQMKVKFEGNEAKRLLSGGMQNAVAPSPSVSGSQNPPNPNAVGFVQRAMRKQMPKGGKHGGLVARMAGKK